MIEEVAAAKINLFLHVGPLRKDGLHRLESLFVFADDGDRIRAEPAPALSLKIEGPFGTELSRFPLTDNLVFRAALALRAAAHVTAGAALVLDKRLPIASGIGGGSADAAAALRALIRLWRVRMGEREIMSLAFSLGADVPACLEGAPVYIGGAGERVTRGPSLPPLWAALANPGIAMPTGPVFNAFDRENPKPTTPDPARCASAASYGALTDYLLQTRNDLEPPAIARAGVIQMVAERLASHPGCLISRMSGSGATVFGLYTSEGAARGAAMKARGLGWWSLAARIRTSRGSAAA